MIIIIFKNFYKNLLTKKLCFDLKKKIYFIIINHQWVIKNVIKIVIQIVESMEEFMLL